MQIVLIAIVIVGATYVNGQEKVSPCPRIFNYDSTRDNGDTWSGVLTLDTQIKLYGVIVDLVFDRAIVSLSTPGTYFDVKKKSNLEYKLEDTNYELDVGATLTIRFSVRFSQYGKTPLLKEVRFNGQKICDVHAITVRGTDRPAGSTPSSFVQPVVPIGHDDTRPTRDSSTRPTNQNSFNQQQDAHYDVSYNRGAASSTTSRRPQASNGLNRPGQSTNNNEDDLTDYGRTSRRPVTNNNVNTGRATSTTTPRRPTVVNANSFTSNDETGFDSGVGQYMRQTTTKRPSFFQGDLSFSKGDSSPHSIISETDDSTCGTVVAKAAPLIVFGESTISGQFPWHAAIYISTVEQLKYICGGVLISRRTLLTAAHCVCIEKSETPINTDSLLIYLGKYNLRKWTGPEQDGKVSEIIVHPDYDHSRFFSDIAVLRLKDDISIDNNVRPVCLWNFNSDLKMIVDKLGEVPGWGYNEYGVVNEVLSSVKMPLVTHETCIWSNRDFFSRVTSDKSFCAGFRNLTSVCNGDSGGGMVFKNNNKWYLRGLVSVSVALQNKLRCDPNEYAVFTDVAKFLTWIRSHM